jgi:uncharacterized spore protein YtfJ
MDLNDLLNGLMVDMRKVSDTATMVGKPLKLGSAHMVPLLSVTIGFGTATTDLSGSGERRGGRVDGGGAGGTMVVTPRAFVVVGNDGSPQLIALKEGKYGHLQTALELAPEAANQGAGTPRASGSGT